MQEETIPRKKNNKKKGGRERKAEETKIPFVTPTSKSSRRNNPFLSLSDDYIEAAERDAETSQQSSGDSVSKMSETTGNQEEQNKASGNNDDQNTQEPEIEYVLDKDLEDLLRDIFDIKPEDTSHEILQALEFDGITSWKTFRRLFPESTDSLSKPTNSKGGRAPIGKGIKTQLNILLKFIRERIELKEENARSIHAYNADDFEDYLDRYYKEKQEAAVSNPGELPPQQSSYGQRSRTEKALDNWEKKKLDKTNFDILKDDSKYKIWKESFVAEIKVQGLTRMIDDNFSKKQCKDQYDRELYDKQSDYLWTVLLYALRNPISEIILGKHRDVSDARIAFLAVDAKMKGKIAQMYNVSELSTTLRELHISTFNGTRVQFIAHWFETLRQLNKIAEKEDQLSFLHVRSQLMVAINTDRDLTHSFTELKEEPDRDLATTKLMDHLLEKAMLCDGRDNTEAVSDDKKISALLHRLGLDDSDLLVNKARRNGPPDDCKLPDHIYTTFSIDDKRQWRGLTDAAKRVLVSALSTKPPIRQAYVHAQGNSNGSQGNPTTSEQYSVALNAVHALRHSLRIAEEQLNAVETQSRGHTAMSSITSQSRPPDHKSEKDNTEPTDSTSSNHSTHKQDSHAKTKGHRGHIARVMANTTETTQTDRNDDDPQHDSQRRTLSFHGFQSYKHHMLYDETEKARDLAEEHTGQVTYNVTKRDIKINSTLALADRGANGCVAGDDCNWIGGPVVEKRVHITGMGDHQVRDIIVGTVGAHVMSNRGPVICIFNETAYVGRGQSILSSIQMEHYRNRVDDRAVALGGGQQITTADGYNFPLSIVNGLPYIQMRKFTKTEYDTLPHVIMTSEQAWNPRLYDNYVDPNSKEYLLANPSNNSLLPYDDYNVKGDYIGANNTEVTDTFEIDFWLHENKYQHAETIARCTHTARVENTSFEVNENEVTVQTQPRTHVSKDQDYEHMKPYFIWVPAKMIKHTFMNSTQYGFTPTSNDGNLFKRWKSPNPAMNIFRLQDDILTDKVHSNTKAIEGGFKDAQIFFGRKSHIVHVESISKTKSFLRCLQIMVYQPGAGVVGNNIKHRLET